MLLSLVCRNKYNIANTVPSVSAAKLKLAKITCIVNQPYTELQVSSVCPPAVSHTRFSRKTQNPATLSSRIVNSPPRVKATASEVSTILNANQNKKS
ncbi:hypothetical protein D3C76_1432440 [compost metagenome]